jgi:TPR repeat protein
LYLKAAEKGDDQAQLNVGMMYFGGKGTKRIMPKLCHG